MYNKEQIGYIAIDKKSKKALSIQFGMTENRTSLTNDIDRIHIAVNLKTLETYCIWFNNQHKNKVDFEMKQVKFTKQMDLV